MKPITLVVLLLILLGLGAALLFTGSDRKPVASGANFGQKLFPDFDPEAVKTISIKKGDRAIELSKNDAGWVVSSHKNRLAHSDRVRALLDDLKAATMESSRPGNPATFDLDEAKRTALELKTESGSRILHIGRSLDYTKSFVRKGGEGDALEVDKPLDSNAGVRTEGENRVIDVQHFYDLKIFNVPSNDVVEIEIKRGAETVKLQKLPDPKKPEDKPDAPPTESWWIVGAAKEPADPGTASSIASNLSALTAKAYADAVAEGERGLDKPSAGVTFKTRDGKERGITFGAQKGDEVVLGVTGSSEVYTVYKYILDNVQRDLKKKEEAKTEPGAGPLVPPAAPGTPVPPLPGTATPPVAPPPAPELEKKVIPAPPAKTLDQPTPAVPPATVKPEDAKK